MRLLLALTFGGTLAGLALSGRPRPRKGPELEAAATAVGAEHGPRHAEAGAGFEELGEHLEKRKSRAAFQKIRHDDTRSSHRDHAETGQAARTEAKHFAQAVEASDLTEVPEAKAPDTWHEHVETLGPMKNVSALQVDAAETALERQGGEARDKQQRRGSPRALAELEHAAQLTVQYRASTLASEVVVFSGATGINGVAINGRYAGTGQLYNGKPLYQKEVDPDRWLRFVTANGLNQWRISSTAGLTANNDKGYAYTLEAGLDDPSKASAWYVWDGLLWSRMDSLQVNMETLGLATTAGEVSAIGAAKDSTILGNLIAVLSWTFWRVLRVVAVIAAFGLLYALHVYRRDGRNLLPIWAAVLDVPGKIRRLSNVVRSLPAAFTDATPEAKQRPSAAAEVPVGGSG